MTESSSTPRELLPTGVPGLDTVLRGGLRRGRTYMVMGLPGAGKTILANQMCFHHARGGERVLYVTLLAESHTELVNNLRHLSFFDSASVPSAISYLSAFTVLEEGGLESLLELLRREIRTSGATFLVLDGLVAAEEVAPSAQALKRFIHSLQVVTGIMGCTTLILTTGGSKGLRAEHTMVDGLIVLRQRTYGVRTVRELYVRKFRGGPHLLGRHGFEISQKGIIIYPRLETLLDVDPPVGLRGRERMDTGVAGLDEMLQGGLPAGSTTLLFGPPGRGKTLLGLSFLEAGARAGELSHYFAFYDSPNRMLAQTEGVGMKLAPLIERGTLEVSYRPPTENLLDKLGVELLHLIRERQVRRLFIDGYDALQNAAVKSSRMTSFMAALINECRARGVTLMYSAEVPAAFGLTVKLPLKGLSMATENILFLRCAELNSRLHRFICTLKLRNSGYDHSLRELTISEKGLAVGRTFEDAQQLVTGLARSSTPRAPRVGRTKRRSR